MLWHQSILYPCKSTNFNSVRFTGTAGIFHYQWHSSNEKKANKSYGLERWRTCNKVYVIGKLHVELWRMHTLGINCRKLKQNQCGGLPILLVHIDARSKNCKATVRKSNAASHHPAKTPWGSENTVQNQIAQDGISSLLKTKIIFTVKWLSKTFI